MHPWNAPILESLKQRAARLPHALLVHGARGIGKLALAERVALFLLCEGEEEARRPCLACQACRWFVAGNHPDLRRVEPEAIARQPVSEAGGEESEPGASRRGKPSTEIKIEQVRALADFLNIGSHRGRLRVALVHPAEDMNVYAANALLKGLEEPPATAVFILVSHRPARLLPTIRSRCVAVPVPVPRGEQVLQWLKAQGAKQAARWLAYAGGAPLRALEYENASQSIEPLLRGLANGGPMALPLEDRSELETLTDALQKLALDRAFAGFGLSAKYSTGAAAAPVEDRIAWLAYARQLGRDRALCRHPLNARLFAAALLASMPQKRG
jgi:DNA polymerase III subunit delta'